MRKQGDHIKHCIKCKIRYGCQIMGLIQFCDDDCNKLCERKETQKAYPFYCFCCFLEVSNGN